MSGVETALELEDWSKKNFIPLNINKCKVLRITRSKCPLNFNYYLNNNDLENAISFKDLSMIFDSRFNFAYYINYAASRAKKILVRLNGRLIVSAAYEL